MKYVIVTPAKNESKYIEHTLKSLINQSVLPSEWIIVDDSSIDDTINIIGKYSKQYDWIKVVSSGKNENRNEGAPIIKAFNVGYNEITENDWDFIVKLDADLTLPEDYFESIINAFNFNERAGLISGYCVTILNGKKIKEPQASYHIRGPMKSIRKKCWEDIGGFQEVLGWDELDEMTAMFNGWETVIIEKEVIHHRPTASDYDQKKLAYKIGYSKYKNGSNFLLIMLRATRRLNKNPYFINSFYYLKGYITAFINNEEKNVSKELSRFINKFHLKRIIKMDY